MSGILIKSGKWTQTHREVDCVKTKSKIGRIYLSAREPPELGKGKARAFRDSMALLTP